MKKLKIGIFMDSWYPAVDGVVVVVDNLATNLSKYADVVVVVPNTSTSNEDKLKPYKIIRIDSVHLYSTEYDVAIPKLKYFSIRKKLVSEKFDIIHIHSPFTIGRLGIKIANKLNIPVIATLHTRFDFEFRKYLKNERLVKKSIKNIIKVYNNCNLCTTVTESMINIFKDYGYKYNPIVIHTGTDMKLIDKKSKYIDKVNKLYNLSSDEIVFLFVGRINEVKNIFFILDVLKILKDKNVKYKMLYVGDGPDKDKLENKIKEYNLQDRVMLCGKVMDRELLKAIYYRAYLFLFPSLFDTSSLVQKEAASQMTPSIFIEGSVTSDTVTNMVNGFMAPDDVNLFADKVIDILNDKELYNKVRDGAYRDLARSWADISKETYNIYLDTIDKYKRENS